MKQTLNPEQVRSVLAFAEANGRNWKHVLRDAWMAGGYDGTTGHYIDGPLQQIRNTCGPSWLTRFSLKGLTGA